MQRVTLVRYAAKSELADENEALSKAVFAELARTRPGGVAYALFRSGDDFVHLFVNLKDDSSDAVTELASFKAYAADVSARCVEPPQPLRIGAELVASYGFEGAMAGA